MTLPLAVRTRAGGFAGAGGTAFAGALAAARSRTAVLASTLARARIAMPTCVFAAAGTLAGMPARTRAVRGPATAAVRRARR
jgi:hypothetical protein